MRNCKFKCKFYVLKILWYCLLTLAGTVSVDHSTASRADWPPLCPAGTFSSVLWAMESKYWTCTYYIESSYSWSSSIPKHI